VEALRSGQVRIAAQEVGAARPDARAPGDRDRRAGLVAADAADLPAPQHAPDALLVLEEGQQPRPRAHEHVRAVVVARTPVVALVLEVLGVVAVAARVVEG